MTVAAARVLTAAAHVAKMAQAHVRRHAGPVHTALPALGHAGLGRLLARIPLAALASEHVISCALHKGLWIREFSLKIRTLHRIRPVLLKLVM